MTLFVLVMAQTTFGEEGADDLYGGFGRNTFGNERDGSIDWLFFKSDQFAYNWVTGKLETTRLVERLMSSRGWMVLTKSLFKELIRPSCPSVKSATSLHLTATSRALASLPTDTSRASIPVAT